MDGSNARQLKYINMGIPSERVFWVEGTGNNTYTENDSIDQQTATQWNAKREPNCFDIINLDQSNDMTIELNNDGVVMTVKAGKPLGPLSILGKINTVDIVATGDYILLLRN